MTIVCNSCGSKIKLIPLSTENTPFECHNCNKKLDEINKLSILLEIFDCIDWKKLENIDKQGLMDPLEHSRDTTKRVHWRLKNQKKNTKQKTTNK